MQNREWRWRDVEKAEWGPGPWIEEPDKIQFTDTATGLPCLIVRNRMGALCGYVGVGKAHPWYAKSYGDDVKPDVHGRLTFSDFCVEDDKEHGICHVADPGEEEPLWWLGFDCGHYMDLAPGLDHTLRKYGQIGRTDDEEIYRTVEYVKGQCRRLATQVAAVEVRP